MAEVSRGPVSTLPGTTHPLPHGTMCDIHPERPAVARVQGETDSFGCEYCDMCVECKAASDAYFNTPRTGYCDWHSGEGEDIRPQRDWEEGTSGRLYSVCKSCRIKSAERDFADFEHEYAGYWDDHEAY